MVRSPSASSAPAATPGSPASPSYADPDRDAPFVRLADEAFALGGSTAGESYLAIDKLIDVARRAGADGVHPGYGFLSRERRLRAGRHRRGPRSGSAPPRRPSATSATRSPPGTSPCARAPRSCPAPATRCPAPDEVVAFAQEHGLPIAIKAAFGGGGRGLKVAREEKEIPRAVRVGRAGGGGRVRTRRVLRGALPGQAPPRRGPGAGRHPRRRGRGRHPRLLPAAPVPEAGRGGARAVPLRRAARDDPRGREGDLPGGGLPRGGHGRVPRRPGRADLVPRGQHAAAGGAPGLGGDLGHRPRARAVPHRRGRAAAASPRTRRRAGTPSSSASTARTPGGTSSRRRARSPRSRCRRGPACGSTRASRRAP